MVGNKENFLMLVSLENSNTLEEIKNRRENRANLRISSKKAITILIRLDELGMSQEDLSVATKIYPERIKILLSGKESFSDDENFSLCSALGIEL